MHPSLKRTALSLCLVASLATPVWAAESGSGYTADPQLISAPVSMARLDKLPSAVTVNGKAVTFDQGPAMVDGTLMIPVRAVAEAAGAEVTWDSGIQLVHVRMPERTIMIQLGHQDAEMNQDGVNYLTRNMLQMAKLPALVEGRTMVSADALTSIFGFQVLTSDDGTLALTAPAKPAAPLQGAAQDTERGTVTQAETGRFLLSGAPMANGEPRLTWASVTDQTKITVQEGDKTRDGSVSDITVGTKVAVKWAGPLTLSYPAGGAAAEVLILK